MSLPVTGKVLIKEASPWEGLHLQGKNLTNSRRCTRSRDSIRSQPKGIPRKTNYPKLPSPARGEGGPAPEVSQEIQNFLSPKDSRRQSSSSHYLPTLNFCPKRNSCLSYALYSRVFWPSSFSGVSSFVSHNYNSISLFSLWISWKSTFKQLPMALRTNLLWSFYLYLT